MSRADLLTDIKLMQVDARFRPVYRPSAVDRRVPGKAGVFEDFGVIEGPHNLGQAVLMRLLTPRGELTALGHPSYGSRLFDLVGRPNSTTTRNLVKLAVLEALAEEPRLEPDADVSVSPSPGTRDRVDIVIRARAVGEAQVVTIGPISLEISP